MLRIVKQTRSRGRIAGRSAALDKV